MDDDEHEEVRAMEGAPSCFLEDIAIIDEEEDREVRAMEGALSSFLEDIAIIDDDEDESCKNNSRSNACEELDASIFRNLPSDILARVLAHLPVACLARARTVCKKLNQIILSNDFLSAQADLAAPRKESWFALFHTGSFHMDDECPQFIAYDPDLNRSKITLPNHDFLTLLVCNPMTKKWGLLPPLLRRRRVPAVSMQLLHHHFKVIVAGDDTTPNGRGFSDLTCEVFDSRTNRWTLSGSIPPNFELEPSSAICNGNLYLITNSSSRSLCSVLSFNLQHGVWNKVQAPMPRNLTLPSLVECSGRLFMVGRVMKKYIIANIRVWELCERSMAWKEVARLKDRMSRELFLRFYFTAVGHGNLICVLFSVRTQMLALDVRTRSWFWLPRYDSVRGWKDRFLVGYASVRTWKGKGLCGYPFNPICTKEWPPHWVLDLGHFVLKLRAVGKQNSTSFSCFSHECV